MKRILTNNYRALFFFPLSRIIIVERIVDEGYIEYEMKKKKRKKAKESLRRKAKALI
jgi:hypothetical protein